MPFGERKRSDYGSSCLVIMANCNERLTMVSHSETPSEPFIVWHCDLQGNRIGKATAREPHRRVLHAIALMQTVVCNDCTAVRSRLAVGMPEVPQLCLHRRVSLHNADRTLFGVHSIRLFVNKL